jgi:Ca2+/Na+ antiporter
MMDEATLKEFKVKFVKLTIILNIIILLIALAIIAFFVLGEELNILVGGLLFTCAVLVSAYFWRSYKAEKRWLDEQP